MVHQIRVPGSVTEKSTPKQLYPGGSSTNTCSLNISWTLLKL